MLLDHALLNRSLVVRGYADVNIQNTVLVNQNAVIFSSIRTEQDQGDADSYAKTAERMLELAAQQPGFLGVESAREQIGITVSYWTSLEAIKAWKNNAEHLLAQEQGRKYWYASFTTRIAKVERDYIF